MQRNYSWLRLSILVLLGAVHAATPTRAQEPRQSDTPRVTIGGSALLNLREAGALPTYPPASLRAGSSGVVVAVVQVGSDGRTATVEVLQAPDKAIEAAVRESFMSSTWRGFGLPREDSVCQGESGAVLHDQVWSWVGGGPFEYIGVVVQREINYDDRPSRVACAESERTRSDSR
jgi:hypothetical protein